MPVKRESTDAAVFSQSPALAELSVDQIAATAQAAGEPEWLIERRVEAWSFFAQATPPEWRRTNLSDLHPETISPPVEPQGVEIVWDDTLSAQGVIFTTLKEGLQQYEDLIRTKLDTAVAPLEHKFSALRAALWQDGVFLYVPKGVAIEAPLSVRYTLAEGRKATFPRSLVILEANSHVSFIEEYQSDDTDDSTLAGPITEIFVGEGGSIRFASVQRWGAGVYHIGGQKVVLGRDANCEWTSVALGGQVQHIEAETRLEGDGSRVHWIGATFADEKQNLVIAPWLRHVGAYAESYMEFKTVVTDEGYSVFDGMIKIEHESRGTSTRLEENAIHLSPTSRNDSIPGLKIDTNDVAKAGHASTSGEIDAEQLFYMQTRGIKRDAALRLIVMGFFEAALNTIPLESLRESLAEAIEAKI